MRSEHLKGWLAAARKKEKEEAPEKQENPTEGRTMPGTDRTGREETEESREKTNAAASNWDRVVDLIYMAFGEGRLAEEATCQAVVLIPKVKKDFCGIGLVEVMWKVVAEILNLQLTASIKFHDFLHGFRAGHVTCTATLEDKLFQQLAALREEVLYMIFLDLHKAYDALDR